MDAEDEDRLTVVPRLLADGRIDEAIEFCQSISAGWQRAESLNFIARVMFRHDSATAASLWHAAIEAAENGQVSNDPQDSYDCSSVLGEIAVDICESGDSNWAIDVGVSVSNDYIRERTLRKLEESRQSGN